MPDVTKEVKGMEYVNCWNMQQMEGVIYGLLCSAMPGEDLGTGNVPEVNDGL